MTWVLKKVQENKSQFNLATANSPEKLMRWLDDNVAYEFVEKSWTEVVHQGITQYRIKVTPKRPRNVVDTYWIEFVQGVEDTPSFPKQYKQLLLSIHTILEKGLENQRLVFAVRQVLTLLEKHI